MNFKDPKVAEDLFVSFFPPQGSRRNPAPPADGKSWRVKLNEMMLGFAGQQTATTTWTEEQWTERLEKAGFTVDQIVDALDMIASWGVTDDALADLG